MSAEPAPPATVPDDAASWREFLERNPSSPSFARVAARMVDEHMPATALRLLEDGLARYPMHATAWLLAAKAYIMLRRYTDARSALERVLALAPSSLVALLLEKEMKELELRFPPAERSLAGPPPPSIGSGAEQSHGAAQGGRKRSRWSWGDGLIGDPPSLASADRQSPGAPQSHGAPRSHGTPEAQDAPEATRPGAFNLEELAQELEVARMPLIIEESAALPPDDRVEEADLHARPVTETLAAIYIRQGKLQEAIDAYRELRALHPERTYEFTVRIIELEQQRRAGDQRPGDPAGRIVP